MRSTFLTPLLLGCAAFACLSQFASAQEKIDPDHLKFFESKIRPILVAHCYQCHSVESGLTRGGLLVDTRERLSQGGESGPAIDHDDIESSPLWTAITYQDYEMPPDQQLPKHVIADFRKWLEMGAPDPRVQEKIVVKTTIDVEAGKSHWAFQKPVSDPQASIDTLVQQKRASIGTTPAIAAQGTTLLRRIYFDLIGLPPTVIEIKSFSKQWKSDPKKAIEKTVDDLLARDQFGERWGRHWLDVARYAESSGNGNFTYPHAWRYRDFVIDAFNKDTPYDTFIQQQLAGDLIPAKSDQQWQENLIATGFLAIGIKDQGERNPRVFEMELIDEQIDTTTQAFLGLTVACARCHDHKFDPIPTVDYYSLAGIFKSTQTLYGTSFGQQNHQPSDLLALPLLDKQSSNQSFTQAELKSMRSRIDAIQTEIRALRSAANKNGDERPDQRTMVSKRNQIARLEGILKTVDENGKPFTFGMGVQDGTPVNANVLLLGDVEQKAQIVERGFLQVLSAVATKEIKPNSSGRRELAQWIGSTENPLTARVMANRVWMHLMGASLVESPNNWGLSSQPPSNPELLDGLAVKFMAAQWSVKSLIREIILSETYQQASTFDAQNYAIDPDNKSFWRSNPRQLDAESLRDAMLAISGLLKTERPLGSEVAKIGDVKIGRVFDKGTFEKLNLHRSVYLPILRDSIPDALALFDFANPNSTNATREETNVPSQSLYLMNNDVVTYFSQHMAIELSKTHKSTVDQVRNAFLAVYGRAATEEEVELSVRFIKQFKPLAAAVSRNENSQASKSFQLVSSPQRQKNKMKRRRGMSKQNQQSKGKRQRGMGMQDSAGNTQRGRRRGKSQTQRLPELKLTESQKALAAFCQSLFACAQFRILD